MWRNSKGLKSFTWYSTVKEMPLKLQPKKNKQTNKQTNTHKQTNKQKQKQKQTKNKNKNKNKTKQNKKTKQWPILVNFIRACFMSFVCTTQLLCSCTRKINWNFPLPYLINAWTNTFYEYKHIDIDIPCFTMHFSLPYHANRWMYYCFESIRLKRHL